MAAKSRMQKSISPADLTISEIPLANLLLPLNKALWLKE
jgi:hypothetical protein